MAWLQNQPGVHFYGQGVILGSTLWGNGQKPLFPDKSITLEIMLRPLTETGNLPGILTLYDGKAPDLLLVGQWKNHLAIRSRTDKPVDRKRGKPYQEIGLRDGLRKDQEVLITITSGAEGTALYQDGRLARSYPRHRLLAGYNGEPLRLVLGNSPDGHSSWSGNLLGLAIFNRALSAQQVSISAQAWTGGNPSAIAADEGLLGRYLFDEKTGTTVHNQANNQPSLTIPDILSRPRLVVLDPPWHDFRCNWSTAQDVTINILGFIPFGFFFSLLLAKTTSLNKGAIFVIIAFAGITLSLAIELGQVYLPTRNSQLLDVFCNAGGTVAGLLLRGRC